MRPNFYPGLRTRTLNFLRCGENSESINNVIRKWNGVELEDAAAEAGLVMAMVRTNEEFRREPQYTEVLSKMPLITVEKIGDSEPVPLKATGDLPLEGIRAFGMGHVIAGGAIGRDLSLYGADVLNIWRPHDTELDAFIWDVQVGMRSTILGDSKEDRAQFQRLLKRADVFFANKRPGFLAKHGLDAEELCAQKPGLIHATVLIHGDKGPWSNRPGFDEVGATVAGLFALEGSLTRPKQPVIVPICDNVVGWLGTTGILAALRRRAIEGGSYRVTVSLTRTVLWLLSLGIFDKAYAQATRRLNRRASVRRAGSLHCGNPVWELSGDDGPGGPVSDSRLLSHRACAAGLQQAGMAGGILIGLGNEVAPAGGASEAIVRQAMLRITVHHKPGGLTLQLEGRLAGDDVQVLKECWQRSTAGQDPATLRSSGI